MATSSARRCSASHDTDGISCPIVGGSSSTATAKMTGMTPAMLTRSGM